MQDIDILNDSESTSSRDEEKVKLNITLDGVSLNRVSSTKLLGAIIDENLTWKKILMQFQKLPQEILECWQSFKCISYLKTYRILYNTVV